MREPSPRWPATFGAIVIAVITFAVVYAAIATVEESEREAKAHAGERRQLLAIVSDLQAKVDEQSADQDRLVELLEDAGVDIPTELVPAGSRTTRTLERSEDGSTTTRRITRRSTTSISQAPQPASEKASDPPATSAPADPLDIPLPEPVGEATDNVKRMTEDVGERAGIPIPPL